MEELLNSVDFAVDFDMDTSDLDCLSDDLLDSLNEDDLLNIDLLSEYEEESQSNGLLTIDSFFVQDKNETADYKSINNIASFLISPYGLSPNQSTPLNGNSINSIGYSSSIAYASNHSAASLNASSIAHPLNLPTYRSQSQLLNKDLIKENSMTDDSYCSSDDDSISSIILDEETSQPEDGLLANRFGQSDKAVMMNFDQIGSLKRSNESTVLSRTQTRCQIRFQSKAPQSSKCQPPKRIGQTKCKSAICGQEAVEDSKQPKRKLSSKGTSLLAKPNFPKKISDSFARTFYQEHNYCFYV